MKWMMMVTAVLSAAIPGLTVLAQDAAAPDADKKYVSREDYDKMQTKLETVLSELDALKKERATQPADPAVMKKLEAMQKELDQMKKDRAAQEAERDQDLEDMRKAIKEIRSDTKSVLPGDTRFLITGSAQTSFTAPQHGPSTFGTKFNPMFLWQVTDRLGFEGELELTLTRDDAGADTVDLSLETADFFYIINDYVTVGAGRFKMPFAIFNSRLESSWINKLPDRPLPFDDNVGIAPEAGVGAFARGGFPAGTTKFNYDVYVTNGPAMITDDAGHVGMMDFDNFQDPNQNKAVGGRVGFLPVPEAEMGYSFMYAQVNPPGFPDANAFFHAVDASYKKEHKSLGGTIDARTEWVWSDAGDVTFTPDNAPDLSGPVSFRDQRTGGYVQLAYRPTLCKNKILRDFEYVARWDMLEVPNMAPGASDERRWTLGVDYWITPSFVLKLAYRIDNQTGAQSSNALLLQAALGF